MAASSDEQTKSSVLDYKSLVPGMAVVLCIGAMVFSQGGFFGLPTCVCGVAASLWAGIAWVRKRRCREPLPIVPQLLAGVSIAYFVSSLMSGATLTTLAETGTWAACAGIAYLAATLDETQRSWMLKCLCWLGVTTALLGASVYAGWLPMAGGMVESRLQFSFQYANVAGTWYGAITFLCMLAPDSRLNSAAFLPATTLLLTQSGGALIVFLIIALVVGFVWVRGANWDQLFQALLQGVAAVVLFALCMIVAPLGAVLAVALTIVLATHTDWSAVLLTRCDAKKASLALVSALAVLLAVGGVLLHTRVEAATASMAERVYHIQDGLALWSQSPLVGVGPNNWQYLYPYIQSAVYYTTVVHSSIVQLMLDAGLFGLTFFAAAGAFGVRGLLRSLADKSDMWAAGRLGAVSFVLLHALIEFDLQFSALAFLCAVLLVDKPAHSVREHGRAVRGLAASAICLALLLPLSVAGVLCAASSEALQEANRSGDYETCIKSYEGNALARADVAAQAECLAAYYCLGDYTRVRDMYDHMAAPSDASTLYAAISAFMQDDSAAATTMLAEHLEAQPYNVQFMQDVQELIGTYGVDPKQNGRLNAAMGAVQAHAGL